MSNSLEKGISLKYKQTSKIGYNLDAGLHTHLGDICCHYIMYICLHRNIKTHSPPFACHRHQGWDLQIWRTPLFAELTEEVKFRLRCMA